MFLLKEEVEDEFLSEGSFMDKVNGAMRTIAKKVSSVSTAAAKLTGLRKTTYDDELETFRNLLEDMDSESEKEDLVKRLESEIASLKRAEEGFKKELEVQPSSDQIKYLIKGAKYYQDEFNGILKKAKAIDLAKDKVVNKKILKYSED